jgi:hypothetical protein
VKFATRRGRPITAAERTTLCCALVTFAELIEKAATVAASDTLRDRQLSEREAALELAVDIDQAAEVIICTD